MELIYSMRRKPLKCEPPRFDSASDTETVRPICTISIANIIAFSSPTELSDVDGDTWGGHVYVCDLDTPWDSHKVTSTAHPVSALEWDLEGKQLLVATTVGDVSVHGQKDYLLNEWQCLYTANFPGEHIVKSAFFHNGRRVVVVDKKPDAPITERIQALRCTPTLKGFGGLAVEGACVVTATGLLGAMLPSPDCAQATTTTDSLRPTRDHVTAASIAYKNGSLLVAAVCGGSRGCVRVYSCSAGRAPPGLVAQPLPAVYLLDNDLPTTVTWCQREEPDSLLIGGATLTLWKCTERAHPVHKLLAKGSLQGSTTPGGGQKPASDTFNTVVWQAGGAWRGRGAGAARAVCVSATRCAGGVPLAVLAAPDHLLLLARDSLHVLSSRPVPSSGAPGMAQEAPSSSASPPKKLKYGPGMIPTTGQTAGQTRAQARGQTGQGGQGGLCHAEVSALGGVCVCVDSQAQLHVYRLPAPAHKDSPVCAAAPLGLAQAQALLELALVGGRDALDLLLALKPALLEPLYERLTESFQRQPASFQQFYYHGWLKLRIALCRICPTLQASASSLTCIQMCYAVLAACSAALRPDLALPILDDDSDKSVATLEAKPELIADAAPLSALRLGLQRALDVAITAVAQQPRPPMQTHGYEVWTEPAALGVVRRLVAARRAAGRGGDAAGRLLARLAPLAPLAPLKQDLIEECTALAAQTTSPRVWESLPRCCVSSPHGKPYPLYFEYGVEPEALRYTPEAPAYAQCETTPSLAMDSIRYMYLGGGWRPARWRACSRCGSRALPAALTARHPLQKAYDARFLSNCRCGGRWTLCSNI